MRYLNWCRGRAEIVRTTASNVDNDDMKERKSDEKKIKETNGRNKGRKERKEPNKRKKARNKINLWRKENIKTNKRNKSRRRVRQIGVEEKRCKEERENGGIWVAASSDICLITHKIISCYEHSRYTEAAVTRGYPQRTKEPSNRLIRWFWYSLPQSKHSPLI